MVWYQHFNRLWCTYHWLGNGIWSPFGHKARQQLTYAFWGSAYLEKGYGSDVTYMASALHALNPDHQSFHTTRYCGKEKYGIYPNGSAAISGFYWAWQMAVINTAEVRMKRLLCLLISIFISHCIYATPNKRLTQEMVTVQLQHVAVVDVLHMLAKLAKIILFWVMLLKAKPISILPMYLGSKLLTVCYRAIVWLYTD